MRARATKLRILQLATEQHDIMFSDQPPRVMCDVYVVFLQGHLWEGRIEKVQMHDIIDLYTVSELGFNVPPTARSYEDTTLFKASSEISGEATLRPLDR